MAKINSTKVKLLVSGVAAINNVTNAKMSIGANMIDVTTKDSAGWAEFLPGLKNVKMSGDGIVDFGATNIKPSDIFTTYLSVGSSVAIIFTDSTSTTGKSYSASGYFSKLDYEGGVEDTFKFSFDIQITGVLTQSATS